MTSAFGSVHAKNAVVLAVALLGAMAYGLPAVASVALGGVIQIVNLRGLARAVGWLVQVASERPPLLLQAGIAARFSALVAAVAVSLWALPVEPIAFVVGLSTVVPAVIWHGLATAPSAGQAGGA